MKQYVRRISTRQHQLIRYNELRIFLFNIKFYKKTTINIGLENFFYLISDYSKKKP